METSGRCNLIERGHARLFFCRPPCRHLFFRPEFAEAVLRGVDVAFLDQEAGVFAAPPIEDCERVSCNFRDTSPLPSTAASTTL